VLRTPRVQFLCFHRVSADRLREFERLLRLLGRHHSLVSFNDALRQISTARFDRPAVAITFDDGFHNQLGAARVLEEYGIRACFFVCPPMLDRPGRGAVARFCRDRLRVAPARLFDWDDAIALRDAGHDIGCHTLSHPDLSACSAEALDEEIGVARQLIIRRVGRCDHFAWPWGRWQHMTALAARRVWDAGFVTCASAERGCHSAPAKSARELCIRRLVLDAIHRAQEALPLLAWSALSGRGDGGWPEGFTFD
jgi:peptidoglycan/xylan/chitin deacetylase (PgdA/CDA1 family)